MFCEPMWTLCTPYCYIMTINLTTRIKITLNTKHNCIQAIIFIFLFVNHFTTKAMSLSVSHSLKACTSCNLHDLQRSSFLRTFHTAVFWTCHFNQAHSVDSRGLRTKLCRTFSIVSPATQRRRWSGSFQIRSQFQRTDCTTLKQSLFGVIFCCCCDTWF